MKDVLEVTLHVRDIIMMILFAKEIYKVGVNLFKILNGIFYKKKTNFFIQNQSIYNGVHNF